MSRSPLWRHHDFRMLWAGDTVSVFGIQFVQFALPLIAVSLLHANAFEMGLLSALESAAFLVISLPAGAWVDRMRKKTVIVAGDLLRAATLLSIPIAWLCGGLGLPQLYIVAAVVGIITVFFDVANQSYLPEIVDSRLIGDGNGKLGASQETARVAGPAAASGLVGLLGAPLVIAVTSVCMGLSSLFVSRIRHRELPPDPVERRPLVSEIREGLAFVLHHRLLRRIVACTGCSNFASSAMFALFILYVIRTLGLSQYTLGIIFSAGAVGGILGALTSAWFQNRIGEGRAIPASAVVGGLAFLTTPAASVLPPVPTLIIGGFATSWAVVVYNVTQVSFRQRVCPKPLLGRMNASIRFLVWGPMPLGAFVGGILATHLGMVASLWLLAGLALLASAPVVLSPLLRMGALPAELDAHAPSTDGGTSAATSAD